MLTTMLSCLLVLAIVFPGVAFSATIVYVSIRKYVCRVTYGKYGSSTSRVTGVWDRILTVNDVLRNVISAYTGSSTAVFWLLVFDDSIRDGLVEATTWIAQKAVPGILYLIVPVVILFGMDTLLRRRFKPEDPK